MHELEPVLVLFSGTVFFGALRKRGLLENTEFLEGRESQN